MLLLIAVITPELRQLINNAKLTVTSTTWTSSSSILDAHNVFVSCDFQDWRQLWRLLIGFLLEAESTRLPPCNVASAEPICKVGQIAFQRFKTPLSLFMFMGWEIQKTRSKQWTENFTRVAPTVPVPQNSNARPRKRREIWKHFGSLFKMASLKLQSWSVFYRIPFPATKMNFSQLEVGQYSSLNHQKTSHKKKMMFISWNVEIRQI